MLFSYRDRLFCPGPTPVLHEVAQLLAASRYHRQADFIAIFQRCQRKLAQFVGSETLPLLLATSGSGAMEAALVNFSMPGDPVLVLNGGKFGERFQKMAQAYGCAVHDYSFPWGSAPDLDELTNLLMGSAANSKLICLQACETSTAVYYPLAEIAALVRKHNPHCLLIVDAISSLVAHELKMQEWDLDCVIGASHKGFGLPPGLAWLYLSPRAQRRFTTRPRFYLDLQAELHTQQEGRSRFTPTINVITALDHVLEHLLESGTALLQQRHQALAQACRAAGNALKLTPFAQTHPANSVTALQTPCDARELCVRLQKNYRVQFSAGQADVQSRLLRIAHLGFVDTFDLLTALSALEFALHTYQHDFKLGDGVRAAMQHLAACQAH